MTNQEIADTVGVSVSTVQRTSARVKRRQTLKTKKGQGRKRKLTRKQERQIAKKAKKGKESPALAREYSSKVGGLSVTTVQRTIREQGLKYLVRYKKPLLTAEQIQRRLRFAGSRLRYNWKYVLFTDEKTWQLGGTPHKSWQDPNDRIVDEGKRHAAKVHVWGGIGSHFKTKLYFFHVNLNTPLMYKILKQNLPPAETFDLPPRYKDKWIFLQDNDPKHKSKKVTTLLDKIAPDRIMDFPAESGDFNIIEDVWSTIDRAIQHKSINTIDQLKKAIRNEWKNLDIQLVRNSVESMPRRLQECIDKKGKRTSY